MTKQLRTSIEVGGVWYRPGARVGKEIPAEVAELIRNPKAWEDSAGGELPAPETAKPVGARLATSVDVDGRWYRPGDKIPADVAARITNPKAWEGGKLPHVPAAHAETVVAEAPAEPAAEEQAAQADEHDDAAQAGEADTRPARRGGRRAASA